MLNTIGLDNLSGVAAILRYPLPGLDDIEEEDFDSQEDENADPNEERKEGEGAALPKLNFDDEQLQQLLKGAEIDTGNDEEEEEEYYDETVPKGQQQAPTLGKKKSSSFI